MEGTGPTELGPVLRQYVLVGTHEMRNNSGLLVSECSNNFTSLRFSAA